MAHPASLSAAPNPDVHPGWLVGLNRLVLRLGFWVSLAVLTATVTALVALMALVVSMVIGDGPSVATTLNAALSALLLTPPLGALLLRMAFLLEASRRQLSMLSTLDPLTGVANRRHFTDVATHAWARCRRYGEDAAVLLVDADHFKSLNDRHGQLAGDAMLVQITQSAAQSLRQADVIARWQGACMAVLLPHTDPLGALDVGERLRERIAGTVLHWHGADVAITVSVGVASVGPDHASLDAVMVDADAALQAAKQAGRNCVRAAPIQPRRSGSTYPVISR